VRLPAGLHGSTGGPLVHEIDARWLMAYAAALGETDEAYFDTLRPGGVIPHPLFPVCYEWPVAVEMRAALPEDVAIRSVHATHDLRLHRPARVGDRLTTRATVIRVEPRRSGSYVLTRFTTEDAAGAPVSTTDYGSIYLGVESEPEGEQDAEEAPAVDAERSPAWSTPVPVAATLAHLYTECARIWNPVHTDRAVARRAGLADIILHGTATLALAVSRVIEREGPGGAEHVTRVRGRFAAMVPMPTTLTVEGFTRAGDTGAPRAFRALNAEGRPAVRDGLIWFANGGPT
jgi:acyl dehydratase